MNRAFEEMPYPPQMTPGPWTLEAGRSIRTCDGNFHIAASDNWTIGAWCELDRNAQAVAAVPDLLAALEAFVTQATKVSGFPQAYEPYVGPLALARAAIHKATGHTP